MTGDEPRDYLGKTLDATAIKALSAKFGVHVPLVGGSHHKDRSVLPKEAWVLGSIRMDRTQFPVLRPFESDTWYDRHGRVAFTNNVNLGIGLDRKDFELWQHCLAIRERLPTDFDRQGLEPPFDLRNREADMRQAYAFFAKELGMAGAEREQPRPTRSKLTVQ